MINFLIQKVFADSLLQGDSGSSSSAGGGLKIQSPAGIPDDVCAIINSVTDFIIAVSIPIAGLMILYGAFLMLTAAESPKRFEAGKNTILYTVIGLAVILLAKGLVVIITQLLGVDSSGLCSVPTP